MMQRVVEKCDVSQFGSSHYISFSNGIQIYDKFSQFYELLQTVCNSVALDESR